MSRYRFLCALGIGLVGVVGGGARAAAVTPDRWVVGSQDEWLRGEAEGLQLTADGRVMLAPRAAVHLPIEDSVVWAVADGPAGSAWIGTGSDGRLLSVGKDGDIQVVATFPELQVTALASDGDSVIAATSPRGAIYRVRPGREPEELARPQAEYIWALARGGDARGGDGIWYVGTGVDGIVYALDDNGLRVFYDAPDVHVVSLLAEPNGTLVAGTAERGLVLRLDAAGAVTVLHDSSFRETRALARDARGAIYAAINGGQSYRDNSSPQQPPGEVTVVVSDGEAAPQQAAPALRLAPPETAPDSSGEVVRLVEGAAVEVMARPRGQLTHSLAVATDGRLFIGTSKSLLVPESGERSSVIALAEPGQISALLATRGGLLVGTTASTGFYRLTSDLATDGLYTSKVFVSPGVARWGRLDWDAELPGLALRVETRSGATAEPDSTWSGWSAPMSEPGPVLSPAGRYFQWRLRLTARDAAGHGAVRSVSVSFQPANLRPVIAAFSAEPAGAVPQQAAGSGTLLDLEPPPIPGLIDKLGPVKPPEPPGKRLYRRGAQCLTWEASDPNGDQLRVALWLRPRDGGPRLRITDRADGNAFAFDTAVLPDGWYVAEIEVSDSPSNLAAQALTTTRQSEPFLVDNTPPTLSLTSSSVERGRGRAEWSAEDRLSALWKADYSVDGQPFRPIAAADGLTDGRRESVRIETEPLASGRHIVVVRVCDLANQCATAGVTLEGP